MQAATVQPRVDGRFRLHMAVDELLEHDRVMGRCALVLPS
jgi:hypothetical protein